MQGAFFFNSYGQFRHETVFIFDLPSSANTCSIYDQILQNLNNHAAHGPDRDIALWKVEHQYYPVPLKLPFVIDKHLFNQLAQIEA